MLSPLTTRYANFGRSAPLDQATSAVKRPSLSQWRKATGQRTQAKEKVVLTRRFNWGFFRAMTALVILRSSHSRKKMQRELSRHAGNLSVLSNSPLVERCQSSKRAIVYNWQT